MKLLNYEIINGGVPTDKCAVPVFSADTYPCCVDLVFSKNMSIHEVQPVFPDEEEVKAEIFKSLDGVNFYRFEKGENIARFVRIFIKYYSGEHPTINSIEIYGEESDTPIKETAFNEVEPFDQSEYNREITDDDIKSEVLGVIGRTIGEVYTRFFDLVLDKASKGDCFTVESHQGKIRLISGNGVGLASAFNCYLKEVCHCHISRNGKQVNLPEALPLPNEKIYRKTAFTHRFVYNYCAHSYTMAFWGEEEWQREIDFLAMNGVNLVMDITGIEEVYRRFLTKLGYSLGEIKNFLVGPSYLAWFCMGNICTTGGPIHDDYFAQRCNLARKNHLKMRTLGMNVVLQAYMGMVPSDIQKKDKGIPIISQGKWNGFNRPCLFRPDSDSFIKYASLFYESQREVFGDFTHYYAGDVCHEGGTLRGTNERKCYVNIMKSILSYDKDAVLVMQSWGLNPTYKFTRAVKSYRKKHILMLDLYAEKKPHSVGLFSQLSKYNYLFGMLNNFGGRNGIYGNLDTLAQQIEKASQKHNFRGIALTSESNNVNPVMTERLFSTVWDLPKSTQEWIKDYCLCRYGGESESIVRAMIILSENALSEKYFDKGEGAPECTVCCRPEGKLSKASCWGYTNIHYPTEELDEAVRLFLADYDLFKNNECYIFDAVDLLRQALSNRIKTVLENMMSAYKRKNYSAFNDYADAFSELCDMLDKVLLNCSDWSLSSYLGKPKEYCATLDDFTRELYILNAKALITTWYSRRCSDAKGYLHDYANRQLGDLVSSFYKMRWDKFIEGVRLEAETGRHTEIDWFKLEWDWVLSDTELTQTVRHDNIQELSKQILER
ncbi:MAG: alpha-N-acetylglucosaminidase TIM-barrel domain-containing protein [Eubacterium sp.]